MTAESPRWFKSSYSDNGGDCVEVAADLAAPRGIVPVRDSKNPGGRARAARLPASFASFVAGVEAGGSAPSDLDRPHTAPPCHARRGGRASS